MNSRLSKVLYLGCLAMVLLSPTLSVYGKSAHISKGENYHFGFVYGSVGYNNLQTSLTNVTPSGAVGGSFGAGYEFRYKGLWVSIGAGAQFHRSSLTLNEYSETRPGFDQQGKEVTFHYDILSQKDQNKWTMVDIPLMVGYYIKGFYVGVGPKLSFVLQPNIVSQGKYDFSAYYPIYNTIFRDMPERGYTQYEFEEKGTVSTNPLVSICAEVGYDILSSVGTRSSLCHVLKIGGYFEYGINSILRPSSSAMYLHVDETNAAMAHPSSFLGGMMESKRVVPYLVGVKITYMIGGSRHGGGVYHRGCMCYQQ